MVAFLCGLVVCFADNQASGGGGVNTAPSYFNWGLLWSGSWEENKNLHNRGEMRLHFLPLGLMLRGQVLDRRPLSFDLDTLQWNDSLEGLLSNGITHFTGGLYHRPTGSRLLYGVLDEWGLSARIRNPWIRSPPYAENHKPLIADLKTAASSTKEDEAYLYLSTPYLEMFQSVKFRGFVSAQTQIEPDLTPALSAGIDIVFAKNKAAPSALLLEAFYTGRTLPPKNPGTWFSDTPPLPEREFHLYAGGLLFSSPAFSVSSDFALSETFAWGTDIYCNLGLTITPKLPFGSRARPLAISLAADGSGERFVNRDGANLSEGFRAAAKIEWKGRYNSLIRLNSVLRADGFGEDFNRSSTGFYWRFPALNRNNSSYPVRLTRISLSADRNAVNPLKINDSFSGAVGLSLNLQGINIKNPIGINFSGTLKGTDLNFGIFPIPSNSWDWNSAAANCELSWSPLNLQFRARVGISFLVEKEEKWDFSFSTAIRFKHGRLSLKVASPDFPEKWNWTASWRLEKKEK